jgi:hypothetical protein
MINIDYQINPEVVTMCHTEPFHIFKANIFELVKNDVPSVTMAWLEKHSSRIALYWNCGEGSATAAETITAFAAAEFSATYCGKEKSPMGLASAIHRF